MQGGAYVLSKESIVRLVEKGLPNKKYCNKHDLGSEDIEIGRCLYYLNVTYADSRDSQGLGRFFFHPLEIQMFHDREKRFWSFQYYKSETKTGLACCSNTAISFHHLTAHQIYQMEYLIYILRPYGLMPDLDPLPQKNFSTDFTENHIQQ